MCNLRHKNENKGNYENYCYKMIKSGKHIELYIYYDKVFKRKLKETNDFIVEINSWDITVNEKELFKQEGEQVEDIVEEFELVKKNDTNVRRSQKRLRRLINSNLGQYEETDKFLTLTYPGLKSRNVACRAFKTFVQSLRRNYGENIQYIAVMEIQNGDRLADPSKATKDIHFHVLLFDCPYIPQNILQDKIWKHGIVDIRKIEDYGDIAGYLVNYLSKDDTLCVKGKRSYFPSRGLKKPIETIGMDSKILFDIFQNDNTEIEFSNEFSVEHVGRIGYIKLVEKDDKKTMTIVN